MRRLALGGLVVMVVLGLAVGGALAADEPTQQQQKGGTEQCQQNQSGEECPNSPYEYEYSWIGEEPGPRGPFEWFWSWLASF